MSGRIVVRKCEMLEEFNACVALQREVWGEEELEVEPATLFVVASNTGGQVLGAFEGASLVGFTIALAAYRNGGAYLYSHMTGVREGYRDRGVGRELKFSQREDALSRGIRLIEWTFDPLEMRNAHFNLNRLGGICRRYLLNHYGVTTSPLHRGLATDRLVAEWYLDSPRVLAAISGQLTPPQFSTAIEVPGSVDGSNPMDVTKAQSVQARIRAEFAQAFEKGYAAVAVSKTATGSSYLLAPWSHF
jgi:predicted GNAT superfamily acetyltransferase